MNVSFAIVTAALALSLVAYVVTGGADFGVGILETFAPRRYRDSIRKAGERAIAPVWEANHVWIILALVIVYTGFPAIGTQLTTSLHFPLLGMLVGIVLRGTAFTFRYYNVRDDERSQRLWTVLFRLGSVVAPFSLGVMAATMARGSLLAHPTTTWDAYVVPWVGWFPLLAGACNVALFAWLAAVFLVVEVDVKLRRQAATRATRWTRTLLALSTATGAAAWFDGVAWLRDARSPWFWITCVGGTLVFGGLVLRMYRAERFTAMRACAGATAACLVLGFWGTVYPSAIERADAPALTWTLHHAPQATLDALAVILVAASAIVLPGLIFLYRVFKSL